MDDVTGVKSKILCHWEITDSSEMHWYLGFQIKWDHTVCTISIHQQAYIKAMVDMFQLTNVKLVTMPMEKGLQLL